MMKIVMNYILKMNYFNYYIKNIYYIIMDKVSNELLNIEINTDENKVYDKKYNIKKNNMISICPINLI